MQMRFAVLALTTLTAGSAAQTTWYVDAAAPGPGDGSQTDPFPTIQAAVDAAADGPTPVGDTVLVAPGTYVESVSVDKRLRLESTAGPLSTIIEPANQFCVSFVQPNFFVELDLVGFTLQGRAGTAGVYAIEEAHLERCIIRDHRADPVTGNWGFGYVCVSLDASVTHCTFYGNDAAYTDVFYSDTDFVSCLFADNGVAFADGCTNLTTFDTWTEDGSCSTSGGDPMLWKPDGSDLHLAPGSPCIGLGGADAGALPYDPAYAPAPRIYCTPKLSSQGCLATIGWAGGAPSASAAEPFLVTASDVPAQKNGMFFFGLGELTFPYQGGWFCIQPPTTRTALQVSGGDGSPCSGAYSIDLNALVQSGQYPFVGPGSLLYGQYWFRDPGDPFQSVRTNAIELGVAE